MFHIIIKKYLKPGTLHIFVFSFLVFIILNVIENVIHYNIGRFTNKNKETKLQLPTKKDLIKILLVMCTFALLQGLLTSCFTKLK